MRRTDIAHDWICRSEVMDRKRGAIDGTLVVDVYSLSYALVTKRMAACASRAGVDERRPVGRR